jgi:rod shape-determining protein MreD
MSETRAGYIAIALSFLVALMLTALPMPAWAALWRPAWVALVLIYWCMAAPSYTGVIMGWTLGLFLDVLAGTLLGQHALALAVVAFVAHRFHRQVRVLPIWQQSVSVFGLVFLYQALILWITGIQGLPVLASAYWSAPLVSMLLWPWIFIVLRDVRRRYQVA